MNITKSKITIEAIMSSIGVFHKVDIDEKSYWIYTSTAPNETLAMPSGGDDHSFQPLFSCPTSRYNFHVFNIKKYEVGLHPGNCSPHFPSFCEQEGKSFLDFDEPHFCKLPVVPLFSEEPNKYKIECLCRETIPSTSYYECSECKGKFHKECVESPLEIKHPSHPFHSLRLYIYARFSKLCVCCKQDIHNLGYHCSTCDYSMHPVCAMKTIPFVVDHRKSHPHPLTYFPAQASLVCNICAMIKKLDPTYICIQCVFVIHEDCIGFPHVIRISRHKHRISFTLSLPPGNLSCGVCRQQVDNNYGAYSCKKCDAYFVHSKCALHRHVWDGEELEGIPEEEDIIDDGEPFKRIAYGIILHPFHSHQLRLEINKAYDINKYCRGCALPTCEDQFYSCMECDFIIHESCANAPRMIRHPSYPRPLTLHVATRGSDDDEGTFCCSGCERYGNGFFYKYSDNGEDKFSLDLRCASIIEPFEYQGHEHTLFLPWNPEEKTQCKMCKYKSDESKLICLVCDYTICYSCAALPYQVKYKHDSHLLTICDGKEANDELDWCEICEGKIEEVEIKEYRGKGYRGFINHKVERRYYKCNDCCTALHVHCLLGIDMYMKPGYTEKDYLSYFTVSMLSYSLEQRNVHIVLNNSLSRPICNGCKRRCPFPIVFKGDNMVFCSWNCIGHDMW